MSPTALGRKQARCPVFTIGHSVHTRERFTTLLGKFGIDVVLDIRSSPYSGRSPQYNRSALKQWLLDLGVRYSFGGSALGGRPNGTSMYVNGRADYLRMAEAALFRQGLRRVAAAARSHRVALLCAEADPLECHRFLLVGRALHEAGLDVQHILPNGFEESHSVTEERLLRAVGLLQGGFFDDEGNALARAYVLQASRVAYTLSSAELHLTEHESE